MERERINERAIRMAQKLGALLLTADGSADPDETTREAASLVHDCVRYLGLSDLAVDLVDHIHPLVERWANWEQWALALAILSEHPALANSERSSALSRLSQAARELGEYGRAEEAARQALEIARAADLRGATAIALNKLGFLAFVQDQVPQAIEVLSEAQHHVNLVESLLERGHISLNMGSALARGEHFDDARPYFMRAIDLYRAADDEFFVARAHCNLAAMDTEAGRLDQAPAELQQAIATFRKLGATYDYALSLNDLGCLYLMMGRYDDARELFLLGLDEAETIGAGLVRTRILSNLGELYVKVKNIAMADVTITEARALASLYNRPLTEANIAVDEGFLRLLQGQPNLARERWEFAYATYNALGRDLKSEFVRQQLALYFGRSAIE